MSDEPNKADKKIIDEAKKPRVELLRHLFEYDPATGLFRWKNPRTNAVRAGSVAGSMAHGYIYIKIGPHSYGAHRLAWAYVHGEWAPDGSEIDHINRVKSDNRIDNLRLCLDKFGNRQNRVRLGQGVRLHQNGKWEARIGVRNNKVYLGLHPSREAAEAVYRNAAKFYFGEFCPQ